MQWLQTTDHLAVFDKMPIDKGTTIEEAVIKLVEAQARATGSTVVNKIDTSNLLAVRYFKDWTQTQFKTSVSIDEIRKVVLADGNVEAIAERVVDTLVQSDKQDKYEKVKGLFKYGVGNSTAQPAIEATFVDINEGTPIDCSAEGGYKKLLKVLKNTVSIPQVLNVARLQAIFILLCRTRLKTRLTWTNLQVYSTFRKLNLKRV